MFPTSITSFLCYCALRVFPDVWLCMFVKAGRRVFHLCMNPNAGGRGGGVCDAAGVTGSATRLHGFETVKLVRFGIVGNFRCKPLWSPRRSPVKSGANFSQVPVDGFLKAKLSVFR